MHKGHHSTIREQHHAVEPTSRHLQYLCRLQRTDDRREHPSPLVTMSEEAMLP